MSHGRGAKWRAGVCHGRGANRRHFSERLVLLENLVEQAHVTLRANLTRPATRTNSLPPRKRAAQLYALSEQRRLKVEAVIYRFKFPWC